MDMPLCDWCGQPVMPDSDLCEKCHQARKDVEEGNLLPAVPERQSKPDSALATTGRVLVFLGKGVAALFLAVIMVVAAAVGTCSSIFGTIALNPPLLFLAFLGFGTAYLMFRLIRYMYQEPQKMITAEKTIEDIDETRIEP